MTLEIDGFALQALEEQCVELGVSVEELIGFSVLYYIADLDSKRIARRVPPPGARSRPPVDFR